MNCPHCGKPIQPQQARAGKALWANLTPEQRSAEMSRRRKAGIARKQRDAINEANYDAAIKSLRAF